MATIKDVARLANVSVSTVSRAISGKARVEPETKERIMRAVELLGYRPNSIARDLKEGRSHTIALILPDLSNPFYPRIVKSVQDAALANGMSLILIDAEEDPQREIQGIEDMRNRNVDGIAIVPTGTGSLSNILQTRLSGMPCVIINRTYDVNVDCVSNDNFYGAYEMTKHLIKNGHTRISALFRSFHHSIYQERYNGCMRALREYGLEQSEKYFLYDVNSLEDAHHQVTELLRNSDAPTAFFATNDLFAMGVYSAVKCSGFQIPRDISVVGYDNTLLAPYMFPALTTFEAPVDEIGRWAVERILQLLADKRSPAEKIVTRGHILERCSVRDLHAALQPEGQ